MSKPRISRKAGKLAHNAVAILMAFCLVFFQTPVTYAAADAGDKSPAAAQQDDSDSKAKAKADEAKSEKSVEKEVSADKPEKAEPKAAEEKAEKAPEKESAPAEEEQVEAPVQEEAPQAVEEPAEPAVVDEAAAPTAEENAAIPEESVVPEAQNSASSAAAEKPAKKTTYIYEDDAVKVTAKVAKADAIPDAANLVVTPVTESSAQYNYGAYMEALNQSAGEEATYTADNTLLYDIAFLMTDKDGKTVEVQPAEGTVSVKVEFKQNQLSEGIGAKKAADVQTTHLPLVGDAKASADTTAQATAIGSGDVAVEAVNDVSAKGDSQIKMTVNDFSVYAFSYTVDFTYDGFTYSIAGESDIMLSELFGILKIDENIANVKNVTFSNPELVAVEQVEGDWKLTSLKPFTSEETLTIEMASGATYVVQVTDAQGAYKVELQFQGYGGEPIDYDGTDSFVVYVELCEKNPDGTAGTIVGWNAKSVDVNNPVVTFSEFGKVSSNENQVETWNSGSLVAFDSDRYVVSTRLYRNNPSPTYHNVRNPGQYDQRPVDTFDGYNVVKNTPDNENAKTTLILQKSYQKEFAVQLTFLPELSTAIASNDRYYIYVDVEHETTGHTYFLKNIETNGENNLSIPVTEWRDSNGNVLPNEKFTGKEQSVTVKILKADEDISYNNARAGEHCAAIAEGGVVKDYAVSYDGDWPATGIGEYTHDDGRHVDSYQYKIDLTKVIATNDYNFKTILGSAVRYGITAEHYAKENHAQTNFAVNHYTAGGGDTRPDLSGNNPGNIVIAQFNEKDDSKPNRTGAISTSETTGSLFVGSPLPGTLTAYVDKNSGNPEKRVTGNTAQTIVVESDGADLSRDIVEPSIEHMKAISEELVQHPATFDPAIPSSGKLTIDTTDFADDATIYIDADRITKFVENSGNLIINKKDDQTIIFNFDSTDSITIAQFVVNGVTTSTPEATGQEQNVKMDAISRHVVWNCNSCDYVKIDNCGGIFLEPNDDSEVYVGTTSGGWIVSDGFVHNVNGEWHFFYGDLPENDSTSLQAKKTVDGKAPTASSKFHFILERFAYNNESETYEWKTLDDVENAGGNVLFENVSDFERGWSVFRITESTDGLPDGLAASDANYYALIKCDVANEGQDNEALLLSSATYYRTFDEAKYNANVANPVASDSNTEGYVKDKVTRSAFDNKTIKVKVSKVDITNDEELAGAHIQILDEEKNIVAEWDSCTDDKQTADIKESVHEISGLKAGVVYTLHETSAPAEYKVAADTTFTVDSYGKVSTTGMITDEDVLLVRDAPMSAPELGKIKITKTIKGSVTPEEAAGLLTFEVKTPDDKWVKADGTKSDTAVSLKVSEFAHDEGSDTYTLEIPGLDEGSYTVTETTKDVDGNDVTVTYEVNGQAGEGDSAQAGVEAGKTTLVAFEDNYKKNKDYEPALEKYINKDVHSDLAAFDTTFTYDILAYIPKDADKVDITDTLDKKSGIEFVSKATDVKIEDIGADNDHTAHGTVEKAKGTKIENASATINGKTLTVTIPDASNNRGHWVRITYNVKLDNSKVGDIPEYKADDTKVPDNKTVISTEYPNGTESNPSHDGVASTASYKVYVNNAETGNQDEKYALDANTITVTPPVKGIDVSVTKGWTQDGKKIEWPSGAEVVLEIAYGGKSLGEVTLKKGTESATISGVPVYTDKAYTIVEKSVKGIDSYDCSTSTAGNADSGYTVTNALTEKTTTNPTVKINKYARGTTTYVVGATLQVLDPNNNVVDEWNTASATHSVAGKCKVGTTYTLRETKVPSGYTKAADVKFQITDASTGTVKIISGNTDSANAINATAAGSTLNLYDARTSTTATRGTTSSSSSAANRSSSPQTGDQTMGLAVTGLAMASLVSLGLMGVARRRMGKEE